ncbi:MAG: hypothetical protein AB1630_09680 [bacterium]
MTNPLKFLEAIHKGGVRYLLIGRQAMIIYGIPVGTMDYDLYIDGGKENTSIFLKIASEFELYPSVAPKDMKKHFMFKLENEITIDVFRPKQIVNIEGESLQFEDMFKRKEVLKERGFAMNVPCLEDLIKLKKTGRQKDKIDVEYLEKLIKIKE